MSISAVQGSVALAVATAMGLAVSAPNVAQAQAAAAGAPDGTVVVQGQRDRELPPNPLAELQNVPRSVSVVSGEELENFNTASFSDILDKLSNVAQSNAVPQVGSYGIRGIGFANTSQLIDGSAGVSVDGVSLLNAKMAMHFDFSDLERVEVNRGPTGTRGGKNATAGSVNFVTRAPSFEREGRFSLQYGSYGTLIGSATAGGGIIDGLLAWRGTIFREQSGSPLRDAGDVETIYRNKDRTNGRLQFLLTPSETFSARFILDVTPVSNERNVLNSAGIFFVRPLPATYTDTGAPVTSAKTAAGEFILKRDWFTQEPNYGLGDYFADQVHAYGGGYTRAKEEASTLIVDWRLPGGKRLESISGYRHFHKQHNAVTAAGLAYVPFDVGRSPSAGGSDEKQISQELRFTAEGQLFDYQAGLYLSNYKSESPDNATRFGSDAGAWLATDVQYNLLMAHPALAQQPGLVATGRSLLLNSVNHLTTISPNDLDHDSHAAYANLDWHIAPNLDLSTGVRVTRERRENTAWTYLYDPGYGQELNPVSVNGIALGGFNSVALNAGGTNLATAGNLIAPTAQELAVANQVAQKYFGVASYNLLTQAQRNQVAAAKAVRLGRISSLRGVQSASYSDDLPGWSVTPSYRFSDSHTAYLAYHRTQKAGAAQISGDRSLPVGKESVSAYELGLKSSLLDDRLTLSTAVFANYFEDYIQPINYYDVELSAAQGRDVYTGATGNVPKVTVKGVEVDAAWYGIQNTFLRVAAAYNDAKYTDFENSALPADFDPATVVKYRDVTGFTLPYAPKVTANASARYTKDLRSFLFHTDLNVRYSSRYNIDNSLSDYSWVPSSVLTNYSVGVGTRDGTYDLNFIVKNLFDKDTGYQPTWNTWLPTDDPRTFHVVFSGKW